jgi:hypothetical protein
MLLIICKPTFVEHRESLRNRYNNECSGLSITAVHFILSTLVKLPDDDDDDDDYDDEDDRKSDLNLLVFNNM